MGSWWLMWMVVMVIFLAAPIGYGWGYRGWGPPYPRYLQRRRGQRAALAGGSATFDHHAWSWGGDLLWGVLLVWVLFACGAFFWR